MKAVRLSREELHRLGYKPGDGRGGVIPVQAMPLTLDHHEALELTAKKPSIRVPRQRHPNATEARWLTDHRHLWPGADFRYEAVSFRLPSGCLYTCDWSIWEWDRLVAAVEVKGAFLGHSARSVLAWKEAVASWPAVRWIFAQWKDGEWAETTIVPSLTEQPNRR